MKLSFLHGLWDTCVFFIISISRSRFGKLSVYSLPLLLLLLLLLLFLLIKNELFIYCVIMLNRFPLIKVGFFF